MILTLISLVLAVLEAAAIIYLAITFINFKKEHDVLGKKLKGGNIEKMLFDEMKELKLQKSEIEKILKRFKDFKEESNTHFCKMGFKRYNPFETTGGDQSFTIVLLNGINDGIALSSLHQRDVTRVYSKLIKNSQPSHKLSKEEADVLSKLLKGK